MGGPKNFNEGSRINTPIITYGYDISFISYFGAKGVAAIDSAMATLNALPAASSANLASFIMQGNQQINYTAQALGLRDLKSTVLSLMMEHLGLIGETHVWDLLTRNAEASSTPCLFEYGIINRNFDPSVQFACHRRTSMELDTAGRYGTAVRSEFRWEMPLNFRLTAPARPN